MNLLYSRHMTYNGVYGINKNLIQIYNNKNIELLGQNLIKSLLIYWRVQIATPDM